jgi:PAS domain-containing protein
VIATVALLLVRFVVPFVLVVAGFGPPPVAAVSAAVAVMQYAVRVTAFYLGALLVAGAALVGWTSHTNRHLSTRGGAYLAAGCVVPWAAAARPVVAQLFDDSFLSAAHGGVGGVVGATLVLAALGRYDVFERVPAAGTVGRDVTVESMNDPVAALVGAAVAPEDLLSAEAREFELDGGSRIVEARGSELRDEYQRLVGHSVVFHDVTDRKRREQRIQVRNRVLRRNLRNDMAVVNGYAETLAAMSYDLERYPERIQETAEGLVGMGEKARQIETVTTTRAGRSPPSACRLMSERPSTI